MLHISLDPNIVAMLEAGATSKQIAEKFRMKQADVLAMKKAWLDAKAEKPAEKKPKKAKAAD